MRTHELYGDSMSVPGICPAGNTAVVLSWHSAAPTGALNSSTGDWIDGRSMTTPSGVRDRPHGAYATAPLRIVNVSGWGPSSTERDPMSSAPCVCIDAPAAVQPAMITG